MTARRNKPTTQETKRHCLSAREIAEIYRAARFAIELGLYLFYLRRVWNYDARQEDFPYWELVFCTDTVSKGAGLSSIDTGHNDAVSLPDGHNPDLDAFSRINIPQVMAADAHVIDRILIGIAHR